MTPEEILEQVERQGYWTMPLAAKFTGYNFETIRQRVLLGTLPSDNAPRGCTRKIPDSPEVRFILENMRRQKSREVNWSPRSRDSTQWRREQFVAILRGDREADADDLLGAELVMRGLGILAGRIAEGKRSVATIAALEMGEPVRSRQRAGSAVLRAELSAGAARLAELRAAVGLGAEPG